MKFWPLKTDQKFDFHLLKLARIKNCTPKLPKMGKIVKVTNHKTIAVCSLWLSRLKNFSHAVSRLDLPTLTLS